MAPATPLDRRAPETETTRLPALDGLRTIAIALVFLYHARVPGFFAGRMGVDVFFPLSGFLITALLLREFEHHGSIDVRRFYARRAARLYPALLLTVALTLALVPWLHFAGWGDWARSAGLALTYTTNVAIAWGHHSGANALSPTWSLALEEQFYLVWPLVLWLMLRHGVTRRASAMGTAVVAAAGWSVLFTAPASQAYFRPDSRLGGLMVGCAAALLLSHGAVSTAGATRLCGYAFALGAVGLVFGASHSGERLGNALGIPFVSVAIAMAIPWLLARPRSVVGRALSRPTLVWLGRRSYGLYLVHLPVIRLVKGTGASTTVVVIVGGAVSIALAGVMFRFVEQPVLANVKTRYRPRPSGAPSSPNPDCPLMIQP